MKGRKPTPDKIKALRGNPGKRRIGLGPTPREGIPPCPAHLCDAALIEWNRIVPELSSCGVLTVVDMAALAGYCQAYGRWADAEAKVAIDGPVVKTTEQLDANGNKIGGGNIIKNPYLTVADKAMEQMLKFLIEFGMTPSSRSRIVMPGGGKKDRLEEFIGPTLKIAPKTAG